MSSPPSRPVVALRPGQRDESVRLSDLALLSKAHWGYDESFLKACRPELSLTPDQAGESVVAERDGVVVGFCLLEEDTEPAASATGQGRLSMLFVDPAVIGSGAGRALWEDAVVRGRARGWRALVLDADPGAEGFYLRMGATRVGEVPSGSVAARMLPQLAFTLGPGVSTELS